MRLLNKSKLIDAHIHLDQYDEEKLGNFMGDLELIESLISVSCHLESCKKNLYLSKKFQKVKPAFGFHPEQPLPSENDLEELLSWMDANHDEMVALGEVGLPYYLWQKKKINEYQQDQYIELLEIFIKYSKEWGKPIVLHAVYDDANIVCNILEKYSIRDAHFHWFKGNDKTLERMSENGYFISVTPDVLYEDEIQQIVKVFPIHQIMVETDGPWPFEGLFKGKITHPNMMHESIKTISSIKTLPTSEVYMQILANTKTFFSLK